MCGLICSSKLVHDSLSVVVQNDIFRWCISGMFLIERVCMGLHSIPSLFFLFLSMLHATVPFVGERAKVLFNATFYRARSECDAMRAAQ